MATILLVAPDAPMEEAAELTPARTLATDSFRIGILDNSKGNADHLLNFIVEGVKREFTVDSVTIRRKPSSSRGATEDVLDDLAREADLVISAMAD